MKLFFKRLWLPKNDGDRAIAVVTIMGRRKNYIRNPTHDLPKPDPLELVMPKTRQKTSRD